MANIVILFSLSLFFDIIFFSLLSNALSSCNGTCQTLDDCSGQLICINSKCNDDPDVGTHICTGGSSPTPAPDNDIVLSSCNGPCRTLDNCYGQLICINGKCNDDPDVGTHICRGRNPMSPPKDKCLPSGTLACKDTTHLIYTCSPTVTSSTKAFLTINNVGKGIDDGRNRSGCDEKYNAKTELVVALSSGWYNGGSRCGKMIRIRTSDGRNAVAKVVDECDSKHGCDKEHAGQPPSRNDIVDASEAVWSALELDKDASVVPITWSMV